MVWKRTYITAFKAFKEKELFQGLIQNYRFVLTRGSKKEESEITLADLPLMNPSDVVMIYKISLGIRGNFPIEFRMILSNFMREYILSVATKDNDLRHRLKMDRITPVVKADKVDFMSITQKKDGLILNKPGWGILYQSKDKNTRTVYYRFAFMEDKPLFSNDALKDLLRRVNANDDNTSAAKKEVSDMLFWWMAVRSFLWNSVPMFFKPNEFTEINYNP